MSVTISKTNKPLNPRAKDLSPKGYNRASLYSGKALDFDGVNDEITPSGSYFVDPQSGTWTFCAWIYAENSGVVFSRDNQYLELRLNSGKLVARIYAGSWQVLTLSNVDLLNEWNFVCWKYDVDNSTFTGYVNGVEQLTETLVPDAILSFDRIASTGGSNFFEGKIGGVKIYDVGLTEAQVSDLYNNPEKIVPDGLADSALKLWLPMMEGVGTTVYDGSGNGNHGTINGATWISGVGAPVAQTALVGWNKGTNSITSSENISTGWTYTNTGISINQTTSPDGYANADAIIPDATSGQHAINSTNITASGSFTLSAFVKAGEYTKVAIRESNATGAYASFDLSTGTKIEDNVSGDAFIEAFSNGWYRIGVTYTYSGNIRLGINVLSNAYTTGNPSSGATFFSGNASDKLFCWGMQCELATSVGPYIPTFATAQTSPVLLPQGLTANKDITNVNSVSRNAYALNLDGASWAEVHDNASLDMTDAITLEAWVYWDGTANDDGILARWGGATTNFMLYAVNSSEVRFYINADNSSYSSMTVGWHHIVGTYDKANRKLYIDSVLRDTDPMTAAITTSSQPVEIGRFAFGGDREYPSELALPRIYNRALTATEVARNYNADKSKFGL
jgi:hypothetical protein